MKKIFAIVCPPLALLLCGKSVQMVLAWLLFALGLATGNLAGMMVVYFVQILWACFVVGRDASDREVREFLEGFRVQEPARPVRSS